jgi:uncharacterized protein
MYWRRPLFLAGTLSLAVCVGVSAQHPARAGSFTADDKSLEIVLPGRSSGDPVRNRPQEPRRPLPYEEVAVRYPSADGSVLLAGTLALPVGPGPHPVVVLISGSGPHDRDGAVAGHRPFLVLSDHLVRRGIAVLRSDERGVGASSGRFSVATSRDFATDALGTVSFLAGHPAIVGRRIGLIGHSEGGMVAPMVAVRSRPPAPAR